MAAGPKAKPETKPKPAEPKKPTEQEYSARHFFLDDYGRTLFPLTTNRVLVEHGEAQIRAFIEKRIADKLPFLPQKRVYAAKDAVHLRRTVKLDPVAEFYVYDIVYRYRSRFRKPHAADKRHFGYRFEDGKPISASKSYRDFKLEVWTHNIISPHFFGFDVASYFNSLYHHDLVEWFSAIGASEEDAETFGRFLRETNAGRSVDCLPQGLYPTKMIGNDFLRYIEESHALRSSHILRFMDDFYLFSDNESDLKADFAEVQHLLGQKGLSVNPSKTSSVQPRTELAESNVDDIKKKLLERRRKIVSSSFYDEDEEEEIHVALTLSKKELDYISKILESGDLEEDDAELVLTVMRHHTKGVEAHIPEIMRRFPHLSKNVHRFFGEMKDREAIARMVLDIVVDGVSAHEFQLFWLGVVLEDYLIDTKLAPNLIKALFEHRNATDISRAKILEIADLRYGLPELRNRYLNSGQSDWLSWSSAVGSRGMKVAARNYKLGYFMNSSDMNRLIGDIVKALP